MQKAEYGNKANESSPESSNSQFNVQGQAVLILVGLIGSGKSTFAQALERWLPQFRRCNQDDLGDRRKVEALVRETLASGLSACVDRTNFDAQQRGTWIRIAREFPGTHIWVIVFETPYSVCVSRLQTRTGHPTIRTAEQGLEVLTRFQSLYKPPSSSEGYDRIFILKSSAYPSSAYSRDEIVSIMIQLQDSPKVQSNYSFSRWQPSRGWRSRGSFEQPQHTQFAPRGAHSDQTRHVNPGHNQTRDIAGGFQSQGLNTAINNIRHTDASATELTPSIGRGQASDSTAR